ncbi:MFS transporter [Natrarchaeobius chitinivorans]|uniref:MFS transporter n=1 Tax=Natrarchaeobius chitinivorans TaxID=1679083 RepID=A0A3N6M2S5_NATCH|nr:MFS transporter [Natrarchaeobius chitinivorans]RQG97733.1 MFS transporter [Natrarchaeobius chitinivorans]
MNGWHYRQTVLVLCTLAFLSTMVARVVISPVVPDLTEAFEVSTGLIGLALSGMWAAYALTQFPSGVFADRYGERLVVLCAIGATGISSAALAFSPSFAVFFVLAVALGGSAGLVYSAATSLVTKQADETGRAIGYYLAGAPIAGLLAPPMAAVVATLYGWAWAIAIGAVVTVPVFVLFAWRVDPTPAERPNTALRDRVDPGMAVELLTRPVISQTVVLAVLGSFTWQATASFLPAFLESFHGFSTASASLLFSAYFVVHGSTQPITGALSDRYSRDGSTLLTMTAGIAGYGLLVLGGSTGAVVLGVALAGLAMSWGAPLQSRFMDNLSDRERGTGFGLVRTVYMLLGSLGSVVIGFLADVAGWDVAFGVLGGCMALCAIVIVGSRALGR